MIIKMLVVGPFASNCFIVASEKTKNGLIIDPGASAKTILKTVDDLKLVIKLIVATHTHPDHVAALKAVKEATGAPYAAHEAEADGALGAMARIMTAMAGGSFAQVPKPDKFLKEDDTLEVDDLYFTVLHTPGHSNGSISLYGHGVVFSGDTLFNYGIGRTDFPGCSHERLMKSISSKLLSLPQDTVVYPGHGPETTIANEMRGNPFLI
jgi:glyoxylase-like metal-dependent hydrolase (beta-lactamase superfamily II)